MDTKIELLVMEIVSQAEDFYMSHKESAVKEIASETVKRLQKEKEITSTECQSALDILKRYKLT